MLYANVRTTLHVSGTFRTNEDHNKLWFTAIGTTYVPTRRDYSR
jgi:hypothetical protein